MVALGTRSLAENLDIIHKLQERKRRARENVITAGGMKNDVMLRLPRNLLNDVRHA